MLHVQQHFLVSGLDSSSCAF